MAMNLTDNLKCRGNISIMVARDIFSVSPHSNEYLAFIRRPKCLCGSYGVQHHTPRDLGEILATCVLNNWQTGLGPACEPAPASSDHGAGATIKH